MENKKIKIGNKHYNESFYRPSLKEREILQFIRKDYQTGEEIMGEDYQEFNGEDVISRMNKLQKKFNSYKDAQSSDPDDAWKSTNVRPITRNKTISIAAHITSSLLYPNIHAQNDKQEEDKTVSVVMRDCLEWATEQAKYEQKILYAIIAMLVNPVAYLEIGYRDVYRTIKEIQKDGSYTKKEVKDEDFTGFYIENVPLDEIYIGNVYEHDIQKQPFLIRRQVIDYTDAERIYGSYSNFKYVNPGVKITFSEENDTFYEQYDEDLQDRYVEVVKYYNKYEDLELVVCNGVLVTESDRPLQRLDKRYPFAKGGYGLIDEGKFYFYKSKVDEMLNDAERIDKMYQLLENGTLLEIMPWAIAYGAEEYNSSIIAPGKITSGLSKDSKVEVGNIRHNLQAGFNMIDKMESSVFETSQDPQQSGMGTAGSQTAYEISRLEQNAMTMLGLFGKMIGFFIKQVGELVVSDILQFATVGEIDDISSGGLKYRTLLLSDKMIDGKKKSKRIEFTTDMPLEDMTEEQDLQESFKIMEQEDKLKDTVLYKVNPNLFRKFKYLVKVDASFMPIKNEAVKKAMFLEAYDRAISNPLANQEAIFRDFLLENYVPGETDKYIKTEEELQAEQQQAQQGQGTDKLQQQILGGAKQQTQKELAINKQL